jgi:hypothetical protein
MNVINLQQEDGKLHALDVNNWWFICIKAYFDKYAKTSSCLEASQLEMGFFSNGQQIINKHFRVLNNAVHNLP